MKTAVEMTGPRRRGKPNAGFPRRPQPLQIAARFPHSHRRDDAVESGKPKTGFPTFHCHGLSLFDLIKKGDLAAELRSRSRLIVRLENALITRGKGQAGMPVLLRTAGFLRGWG